MKTTFECVRVNKDKTTEYVEMAACRSDDGKADHFHASGEKPVGTMYFHITNSDMFDMFVPGEKYVLDIRPAG